MGVVGRIDGAMSGGAETAVSVDKEDETERDSDLSGTEVDSSKSEVDPIKRGDPDKGSAGLFVTYEAGSSDERGG